LKDYFYLSRITQITQIFAIAAIFLVECVEVTGKCCIFASVIEIIIVMTTLELRTSIVAELDQMSVEMLESVQHYVRHLRRHARPTRRASTNKVKTTTETDEFTPRVMRFKRGNPWYATDEEVDRLRYEYLTEKFK